MSLNITALREQRLPVNPFTDHYWEAEIKHYGLRKSKFHVEHVCVDWVTINGRCDDYLNVNMRFSDVPLPRLAINDHVWMSLTPMEVQSTALAIHRATGRIACGGLGLGYFVLRAAAKPDVTEIVVFEKEPLIVEWFNRMFKGRAELAKIKIVEGDIFTTFKGYAVDFCFMDIYQEMLPDAVIADCRAFRRRNQIGRYHFWGYERVVLELLLAKKIKHGSLYMGSDLGSYFRFWKSTPMGAGGNTVLGECYRQLLDADFLRKAKRVMVDFPM